MKTKHYNQKQGTLKHYKNENKTKQSKTRKSCNGLVFLVFDCNVLFSFL
jgi:hypothetical protein